MKGGSRQYLIKHLTEKQWLRAVLFFTIAPNASHRLNLSRGIVNVCPILSHGSVSKRATACKVAVSSSIFLQHLMHISGSFHSRFFAFCFFAKLKNTGPFYRGRCFIGDCMYNSQKTMAHPLSFRSKCNADIGRPMKFSII